MNTGTIFRTLIVTPNAAARSSYKQYIAKITKQPTLEFYDAPDVESVTQAIREKLTFNLVLVNLDELEVGIKLLKTARVSWKGATLIFFAPQKTKPGLMGLAADAGCDGIVHVPVEEGDFTETVKTALRL